MRTEVSPAKLALLRVYAKRPIETLCEGLSEDELRSIYGVRRGPRADREKMIEALSVQDQMDETLGDLEEAVPSGCITTRRGCAS